MIKNRIKVLRAEHDLTQDDLAQALGVSRQAIISIEKYKYKPSLELAFKISKLFDQPIDTIFEYIEDEDEAAQDPKSGKHFLKKNRNEAKNEK